MARERGLPEGGPTLVLAPVEAAGAARPAATGRPGRRTSLDKPLETERAWVPDREAMAAALRVVLGLPAQLPSAAGGGER
jgi:hypothetical protein